MNYEKWDRKESFTFVEAAMLWCGHEEFHLFSRRNRKYLYVIVALKKMQDDAESGILSFDKPPSNKDSWDDAIVTRDQLKKWANLKGDKPHFLFPEERISLDYSDWDKREYFTLIDAATLWYNIDSKQRKVDRTNLSHLDSLFFLNTLIKLSKEGLKIKLPVLKTISADGTEENKVSREVLRALAILLGAKPAFLFPENRRSKNILSNVFYKEILTKIHYMGRQFERLPSTHKSKQEEDLRDNLLVMLDGQFGASATGETFNKKGKTDILLKSKEGGNIFVAECKFWCGEKGYLETITQLLKYLTWRDSKAAVIMFVRNKNFSSVLDTVKNSTNNHPNYLSYTSNEDDTWFNYLFFLNEDINRQIKIAVMLYHLTN
ncbi:MAG: hypothetical protein V2B19_12475 [Pseudomonadota bacterium]